LPLHLVRRTELTPGSRDWLHDEGSLTRRVLERCGGRFRVDVCRQGWSRPLASESQALGAQGRQAALLREVVLRCAEAPWVFARTLIPATTLQGSGRRLALLRDRPLGALLFADPGVERGALQVARLLPDHVLFRSAVASLELVPKSLWARRTLYYMDGRPLLVNEVFLPHLPGL